MANKNNNTILLIEDPQNPMNHLENLNHHIIRVQNKRKAIKSVLATDNIILVLIDLTVKSDHMILKFLQDNHIPVLFLYDHEITGQQKKINQNYGNGIISKNTDSLTINSIIRNTLSLSNLQKQTHNQKKQIKDCQDELQTNIRDLDHITNFSLSIASQSYTVSLPELILSRLKEIIGAPLITFVEYDKNEQVLKNLKLSIDQKILDKVLQIGGEKLQSLNTPVSAEKYQEITHDIVGRVDTLVEGTSGAIPSSVDKFYRKISGVNRFFGIAYMIDGELFGTSLIGLHKNQKDPSKSFLESFAHIAAVALKNNKTKIKLSKSEQQYKNIIDNMKDAVYTTRQDGIMLFISENIKAMSGLTPKEVVGRHFRDFIFEPDAEGLEENFKRKFQGDNQPYDFRLKCKDGTLKWMRASSRHTHLDDYNTEGVNGVLLDITKEKKDEEKIKQLLEEKSLILKEVHHRIKNNMNVVSSLLRIESKKFSDDQVKKSFLNTAQRVQGMMILYDKLYRSKGFLKISLADYLGPLISEILKLYPDSDKLEIITDITTAKLSVKKTTSIGIIVNELITNSLKHAFKESSKGTLIVTAKEKDNHLYLKIKDDGIGINKHDSPVSNFGLQLIDLMTQQIKGDYHLSNHNGTTYTFKIPK